MAGTYTIYMLSNEIKRAGSIKEYVGKTEKEVGRANNHPEVRSLMGHPTEPESGDYKNIQARKKCGCG
jgi:hypothetical protein